MTFSFERLFLFKTKSYPLTLEKQHIGCSFLTWFGNYFSAGQFLSVRSFLIAAGFFLLSFVRALANLKKIGFEFHLRSSPSAFCGYGWSVDQLITNSLLAAPYWRDPTRSKQLFPVATLGFQFGLNHVAVPLSFLRSISLAYNHCFHNLGLSMTKAY